MSNFVVLGTAGIGKSTLLNTLAGEQIFEARQSLRAVTTAVEMHTVEWEGQPITLIDVPGFDFVRRQEELLGIIRQLPDAISLFGWVFNGTATRWNDCYQNCRNILLGDAGGQTDEEKRGIFGREILQNSVLIFTNTTTVNQEIKEGFAHELGFEEGHMPPCFVLDNRSLDGGATSHTLAQLRTLIRTSIIENVTIHPVLTLEARRQRDGQIEALKRYWDAPEERAGLNKDILDIMLEFNRQDAELWLEKAPFQDKLISEVRERLPAKLENFTATIIPVVIRQMRGLARGPPMFQHVSVFSGLGVVDISARTISGLVLQNFIRQNLAVSLLLVSGVVLVSSVVAKAAWRRETAIRETFVKIRDQLKRDPRRGNYLFDIVCDKITERFIANLML